ncbi:MAG: hypothetical protein ICCCNLDF_03619 [Planctomycetes bacterium]|nr:hypothetical protein [Planctomycetota bacterium]
MSVHMREQVAKAALLGLERGRPELPAASGALAAAVAGISSDQVEARWLDAAALASMHAHAGRLPPTGKPPAAPCPADSRAPCGDAARRYLATMLGGRFDIALPEFVTALDVAGLRMPEVQVPPLLDKALAAEVGRDSYLHVCGEVGRWLGGRNTNWSRLYAPESPTTWTDGTLPERALWLREFRTRDVDAAREALAAVWEQEDARTRSVLLAALAGGVSMSDEPFLESALDDRRKEVRAEAAALLATLPQSRFVQRMRERLKPLLKIDKKGRIEITLPATFDKSMERDAIEKSLPYSDFGDKAAWLAGMIACVPPGEWCRDKLTPEKLLKQAGETDWALALRFGWSRAAALHRDEEWCSTLLRLPVGPQFRDVTNALLRALPADTMQEMLARLDGVDVLDWPAYAPQPWSGALTLAAAGRLQDLFKRWNANHYRAHELPRIAALMDLAVTPEVAKLLDSAKFEVAAVVITDMLDLLRFRREAHDAIKEKP